MQGDPIEVTVRFSNASGDPASPTASRTAGAWRRSSTCPDGSRTDILAVTAKRFFARTPEEFIEFNRAVCAPRSGRPRPNPVKMLWYLARHPKAAPAVAALRELKPIPSYAQRRYNSLHAFRWVDAAGGGRHVRYSWLPEEGEATITSDEAKSRPPDYLQRDLAERLNDGRPIRFTLELQLAAAERPGRRPAPPLARRPRTGHRGNARADRRSTRGASATATCSSSTRRA